MNGAYGQLGCGPYGCTGPGGYGQLSQPSPLFLQHSIGYRGLGYHGPVGQWGQTEPVVEDPSGFKLVSDIASIVKGLVGAKTSWQLAAQLEAAKRRGAGASTLAELEGALKAARDSEAQAALWRTLGAAAIIGVIGLTAAASFALVSRGMRK